MPSKSKAQRAFLIKVVADEEFAKSRKMSQDVARGILDEDEEHIAKDKHWADHLPDRAGGHSMESRAGDNWYNPEYIDLLVEQQVHPSFESFRETLHNAGRFLLGKGPVKSTSAAKPADVYDYSHYDVLSKKPEAARDVRTGTADFSSYAARLAMKTNPNPFWPGLIKSVEQYVTEIKKVEKDVTAYCAKAKAIYKKCETMQPPAARTYADTEMRKLGLDGPGKPAFSLCDFEVTVGPHGGVSHRKLPGVAQRVMCEYPTKAQYDKLCDLLSKLWLDSGEFDYWTLDDTDEIKWWDHHFPGQSESWGPMINLFPFAGEVRGVDTGALYWSHDTVCDTLARLLTAVSQPKAKAE